jgi:2-hydroxychromene-2-carboxylate isomerase
MNAYWAEGRDIVEPDVLADVAAAAGVGADVVAAAATDEAAARACADETRMAAEELGIFGAPHMLVDGEPFWGHDRIRYIDMWLEQQAG